VLGWLSFSGVSAPVRPARGPQGGGGGDKRIF
jgi:hypothetical protein